LPPLAYEADGVLLTSAENIEAAESAGLVTELDADFVYVCPMVSIASHG
jgi:hypothetical protein